MNQIRSRKFLNVLFITLGIGVFTLISTSSISGYMASDQNNTENSFLFEQRLFGPTFDEITNNSSDRNAKLDETIANCRYGVVASAQQSAIIPTLGAGWILKFSSPFWPVAAPPNNAERAHVIKTHQLKTAGGLYLPGYSTNVPLDKELADYIRKNPGDLWMIGNEVERGPQPGQTMGGQGDMFPEIYAIAYHEVREFIKLNDPSARIAISGLVEVTPGRLQYLDKFWKAYFKKYGIVPPVDVWNMHVYVLPEVEPDGYTPNGIANVALGTDPTLGKRSSGGNPNICSKSDVYCFAEHDDITVFAEQVTAMRLWMKDHGQQQKPLVLSEFSILYPYVDDGDSCFLQDEFGNCFTPQRIINFMDKAFDYLNSVKDPNLGYALDDNRLVQQWLWFAVHEDGVGVSSNLVEADLKTLTKIGQNYRDSVYDEPLTVNLLVDHVPYQVATIGSEGTAEANITVKFRNNGNSAVETPYKVTFYKDAARTQEIDSVLISSQLRGCATGIATAGVTWSGLEPGEHQFWVEIDSENDIDENPPQENDNIGSGFVLVNTDEIWLPTIRR